MNFADRLKEIRKREGLSQEELADKIGVSRQAITKWETGKGLPDIENMVILSEIFKLTLDELISAEAADRQAQGEKYRSETIYDIDAVKYFDIKLISAKQITITSNKEEKLYIKLESETMENLSSLFKVKLEMSGNKLEVTCMKKQEISEKMLMEDLYITISLPDNYLEHCEVEAKAVEVNMSELSLERFEYDGDASQITIRKCSGSIEFAGKSDYNIAIDKIQGKLEITQINARTMLHILEDTDFRVETKRKKIPVFWEKAGENCEKFDNSESENILSVNGIKSEIIISVEK